MPTFLAQNILGSKIGGRPLPLVPKKGRERRVKKDPESWVPKDKVIGGYVMNCTSVKKDNVVVPEAATVSVDKTVKMFDLSALKTVGAATVSVDTTSDEDNMSVHTAIEAETEPSVPEKVAEPTEELLEWTVVRNLGDDTKFLSKSIVTVEDYIKKQASFKNAGTEDSDDHFGFQIPNLGKSLIQGTYLSKSGFIKVGGKAHSVFVDRINFPCALEILFDDRNIRHIRHNGIAYITFDSLPSKIADQLVAARVAFNHLNASAPIYIANSKKYNTKFTLSRNWEITLQNDAYEVVLTSEDIINGKEIDTLVTNENCRQTLKMALKKPLREPCSPRNKRFLPSCDFRANENEMKIVATKVTGTVKYYSFEHNVGFITRDDGKDDIYVHQKRIVKSSLTPWERYLVAGEKVEFDVGQYTMGDPEAVNVTGPDGSEVEGDYVLVQRKHFPRP
uniref:CSD domain-containing protein n=1 Tax=Panagrellus redivivus TaxID=6233 RepID=A0A7E4VWD3_PANRE